MTKKPGRSSRRPPQRSATRRAPVRREHRSQTPDSAVHVLMSGLRAALRSPGQATGQS